MIHRPKTYFLFFDFVFTSLQFLSIQHIHSLMSLKETDFVQDYNQSENFGIFSFRKMKHSSFVSTDDLQQSEKSLPKGMLSDISQNVINTSGCFKTKKSLQVALECLQKQNELNQGFSKIENYSLREEVGKGSFATVYRAIFLPTCQQVAVKVIDFNQYGDQYKQMLIDFYEKEVKVLQLIQEKSKYQFSCHFYSNFVDRESAYIVLQYLEGISMNELIYSEINLTGDEKKFYLASLVLTLQELHKNIGCIHRDIKPENIMIQSDGQFILLDYGCAKAMKIGQRTSSIVGTCQYFCPSRFKCKYGWEADIWAFAVIAFQLQTKSLPFKFTNMEQSEEQQKFIILSSIIKKKKEVCFKQLEDADPKLKKMIEGIFNFILDPANQQCDISIIKEAEYFLDFEWKSLKVKKMRPPRAFSLAEIRAAKNLREENFMLF